MRSVILTVFVVSVFATAVPAEPTMSPCSLDWDPFIQGLIDQVNTDSLTSYIQRLQDFRTRMALSESSAAVSQWIADKFTSWGYAAEFDSFYMDDLGWPFPLGFERNVIATLPGTMGLPLYYIIGGALRLNDLVLDLGNAPGADDNASGVAAALEAARIMGAHGFDKTIKFICWGAEEVMFDTGASHYSQTAVDSGWAIAGMLNSDMIGYQEELRAGMRPSLGGGDFSLLSSAVPGRLRDLWCRHSSPMRTREPLVMRTHSRTVGSPPWG